MIHDQPGSTLSGQIGPDPLQEDADAQIGLRQELEVHRGPGKPCQETADTDTSAFQNGKALANHGHVAFVKIPERSWSGLAGNAALDEPARIAPLLDRHLRYCCG